MRINSQGDNVNQEKDKIVSTTRKNTSNLWVGNLKPNTTGIAGLRYNNVRIPQNSKIVSAVLSVYSALNQNNPVYLSLYADNTGDSPAFTNFYPPGGRPATRNIVSQNELNIWKEKTWYNFNDLRNIVQEIVNRRDWQPGNSISIIIKNNRTDKGVKYVESFRDNPEHAPVLTITYDNRPSEKFTPTPVPIKIVQESSVTASMTPSNTPIRASASNTPIQLTPTPQEIESQNQTSAPPAGNVLPGDTNNDGRVDGFDYSVWLVNKDKKIESGSADGDFNGDKIVDNSDLEILMNNFDF